ncbi:hypothetical protein J1614_009628 [Plenodomus biglobosus]|nr:hypothetical protein J1614_009628 [Plenodomus biglobosus]
MIDRFGLRPHPLLRQRISMAVQWQPVARCWLPPTRSESDKIGAKLKRLQSLIAHGLRNPA